MHDDDVDDTHFHFSVEASLQSFAALRCTRQDDVRYLKITMKMMMMAVMMMILMTRMMMMITSGHSHGVVQGGGRRSRWCRWGKKNVHTR